MNELRKRINEALGKDLPGDEAHALMMNYKRETAEEVMKSKKEVRLSAVLLLLYPHHSGPRLLLLKRHDYEGVHSGQVGLPGGKVEDIDQDLLDTALRECKEESGVQVQREQVIGRLSDIYIPPSNFLVHPYVALIDQEPSFTFDEKEVRFPIEVGLDELLKEDNVHSSSIFIPKYNSKVKVKHFLFSEEIVWGATAMILMEFKQLVLSTYET